MTLRLFPQSLLPLPHSANRKAFLCATRNAFEDQHVRMRLPSATRCVLHGFLARLALHEHCIADTAQGALDTGMQPDGGFLRHLPKVRDEMMRQAARSHVESGSSRISNHGLIRSCLTCRQPLLVLCWEWDARLCCRPRRFIWLRIACFSVCGAGCRLAERLLKTLRPGILTLQGYICRCLLQKRDPCMEMFVRYTGLGFAFAHVCGG